jgi:O-Antigen ligase
MKPTSEMRIDKLQLFLIAVVGWFASGSLSFLELSEPQFDEVYGFPIAGEVSRVYSYLAFLFMMMALLSTRHLLQRSINYAVRSLPICLLMVSGVMEGVVAVALGFYVGAVYAVLLLICVLVCSSFWCLPERHRLLFYKFLLVVNVVYVCLAFIMYGAPHNRFVGGIHPNIFSQAGIALAFSALMFLSGWKKTVVILASLFVAYLVDSRYALATVFIMYFGLLLLDSSVKAKLFSLVFFIALAAMFLFTNIFSEVFSLNDANRGISSGASGRLDNWENFLPQLSEHPFFGYGFRNHDIGGAHNGFMQYVLENGLVISFIFFSALILILISNASTVWHSLSDRTFQVHEGRVVLVTLLAIVFAANLQPQLINFGDEFGPLTLMILMYVPVTYRSFGWRRSGDVRRRKPTDIRPART